MKTKLGKIEYIKFGIGGYQESMFGLSVGFVFDGYVIQDFISGGWCNSVTITENTKLTEEDRSAKRVSMCHRIEQIMKDAKIEDINLLKGKPVEITLDGESLKSWRILTEVL